MNSPLVNSTWLRRNFDNPDLIILDGSPASNKAGMKIKHPGVQISGARTFDLENQFSNRDTDLPNMMPSPEAFTQACRALGINSDSKIVIYDNLDLYSSPRVWWMLKTMGHEHVAVLDGGLNDWISSGGATEPISKRSYEMGNFMAQFDAARIKNAEQVLESIESKKFAVVDARSAARFNADVAEPRPNSRRGHIPGSLNLPFSKLCRNGKFLPEEDLKALFDEMRLGNNPVVFTCGSGMTACIDIMAATLVLDNELALYDGSWREWGDADAPWPIRQKAGQA